MLLLGMGQQMLIRQNMSLQQWRQQQLQQQWQMTLQLRWIPSLLPGLGQQTV
jgi:hypothetical protein